MLVNDVLLRLSKPLTTTDQHGHAADLIPVQTARRGQSIPNMVGTLFGYARTLIQQLTRLEIKRMSKAKHKHEGDAEYTLEERTLRIYRIIRFFSPSSNRKARTIKNGLTLQEAQQHCSREDTSGASWFDGYDLMKGIKRDR